MSIKCVLDIHAVNVCYSATRTSAKYLLSKNHQILIAISFVLLLLLSACGGGGSSPGTNTDPQPRPATPAPVNPDPITPAPVNPDPITPDPVTPTPVIDPISFVNPGPEGVAASINGDLKTAAMQNIPVIKFNDAGAGIAVWQVESITGLKVLYSLYDPLAQMWSEEAILYYGSYLDDRSNISLLHDIQLATNGTGFAITWSDSQEVYVKQYEPAAIPQWGDVITLSTTPNAYVSTSPKIESNGTEYVVTWRQSREIVASMSNGLDWSAVPVVIGDVLPSATLTGALSGSSFRGLEIISDGQGFLISWIVNEAEFVSASDFTQATFISHVYASVYTSAGGWGSVTEINESNLDSSVGTLKLAANSNGYIVTWWADIGNQRPYVGKANIYHTNAINGPQWLGENAITGQAASKQLYSLIASNNGFVFVWRDWVDQLIYVNANIFSFNAVTGWQGETQVSPTLDNHYTKDFDVASNGEGYMVVSLNRNTLLADAYELSSIVYDGVSWSVESAALATTDNAAIKSPAVHSNGTDYIALWKQEVFGQTKTYDVFAGHYKPGTGWSSGEIVETGIREPGSPIFHTDQVGISNVGEQYFAYWVSVSVSGEGVGETISPTVKMFDVNWHESKLLSKRQHLESSNLPTVMANDDGQLLSIWLHTIDSFTRVFASVRSNELWSNPVQIDQDERNFLSGPGLQSGQESRFYNAAANGSTFMVVWEHRSNIYARLFDGQGWYAEPVLVNDEGLGGSGPSIVPYGEGYIIAWSQRDSTNQKIIVHSAIYNNGVWTQKIVADMSGQDLFSTSSGSNPKVASNNNGEYIIVWSKKKPNGEYEVQSRINVDGQWLNQNTLVQDSLAQNLGSIQSVANSAGKFIISWHQRDSSTLVSGSYTSFLDPVDYTWSAAELLPQSGSSNLKIVSGGDNFAIIWRRFDSVVASIYENNNWSPNTLLSFGSGSSLNGSISLSSNGSKFAVVWQERDSTGKTGSYISQNDGTGWSNALPISTLTAQQQAYNPSIFAYKDNFAAAWVQSDSSVDPVFTNIWSKAGGF